MYFKVYNVNNARQAPIIVPELTDYMWELGYRMLHPVNVVTGDEYLKMNEDVRQISIDQYGF